MEMRRQYTRFFGRLQYGHTRTIAKDDGGASAARSHVEGGGLYFCTHHECGLIGAVLYKLIRDRQSVDESGACVSYVDSGNAFKSQLALQEYAGAWKEVIRCDGRKDDEVDIPWREPRTLKGHFCGFRSHIGDGILGGSDKPAFVDSRSLHDPLVVRVHNGRARFICAHRLAYMMPEAHSPGITHRQSHKGPRR